MANEVAKEPQYDELKVLMGLDRRSWMLDSVCTYTHLSHGGLMVIMID